MPGRGRPARRPPEAESLAVGPAPCEDRPVKVETPLGAYPFTLSRIERREDGLAILGLVAGMESGVVIEPADLTLLARRLGPSLAVLGLVLALRRRLR